MKKLAKLLTGIAAAAAIFVGSLPLGASQAKADALRVVTLGADLSNEQQQTMLRYFKVKPDEVRIIYVTNKDEREHLASYVPLEQIGTRTVSCAYVRPTTSGGIKVRTANLNWVTGNMIASSMTTSGVTNCEIIAACPFEVSGTGALTGVQMAYEVATGARLDEGKKNIANEEIVVTGSLANKIGQDQAVSAINQMKMEVIGNNIQDAETINNVVNNVVNNVTTNNGVQITPDQISEMVQLLEDIAAQNYNYKEMEDTLQMIDDNVAGQAEEESLVDGGYYSQPKEEGTDNVAEAADEDSIMFGLNEEILGDDVITSATDESFITGGEAEEDAIDEEDEWLDWNLDDFNVAEYGSDVVEMLPSEDTEKTASAEKNAQEAEGLDNEGQEAEGWDTAGQADEEWEVLLDEGTAEAAQDDTLDGDASQSAQGSAAFDPETADLSKLDTEDQELYTKALHFCKVEYEGGMKDNYPDLASSSILGSVVLDTETGKALTGKIMKSYYDILSSDSKSSETGLFGFSLEEDEYISPELNKMAKAIRKLFGTETGLLASGPDAVLSKVAKDDCKTLSEETIDFFEDLYGESAAMLSEEDEDLVDPYVQNQAVEALPGEAEANTDASTPDGQMSEPDEDMYAEDALDMEESDDDLGFEEDGEWEVY